tara:strand:- start:195 stop:332 length:138 start_codon:yes stop_codon:yes gene_type:complete
VIIKLKVSSGKFFVTNIIFAREINIYLDFIKIVAFLHRGELEFSF